MIDINLNFLRFLTYVRYSSLYDNEILVPLYKELPLIQLKEEMGYFAKKLKSNQIPKDLNLYIHIPYCADDCSFCHCSHLKLKSLKELQQYERFLISQFSEFAVIFSNIKINSIYFGGGTPSLLSKDSIIRIFDNIYKLFKLKDKIQINFEAHPSSLTLDKLKILKEYGVNRISLGVQSLDERVIRETGRKQTQKIVNKCIDDIRRVGFPYLNLDILAGLPGQSKKSLISDLNEIIKLKPEIIHLTPFGSIFSTRYYQNNRINIYELMRKRDDMIQNSIKLLKNAGYKRYGFENFQLSTGGESSNEYSYFFNAGSILGLGAFAKSNLACQVVFETCFRENQSPPYYFNGCSITEKYSMANFVISNLLKGLDRQHFYSIFAKDVYDVFNKEFDYLIEKSLVSSDNNVYKYDCEKTVKGLFDYFTYTKILYGNQIISHLRNAYGKRYDSSEDYGAKRYLINFLQDYFVLGIYYDVGC